MVGKFIDEEYANRVSRAELAPIERSSVKRSTVAMTSRPSRGYLGTVLHRTANAL